MPAMDMAKTFDAVHIVAIACSPVGVNSVVGAQVDHAKGATSGVEKEPTGVGCVDEGVDEVDGGFLGILGESRSKQNQQESGDCK